VSFLNPPETVLLLIRMRAGRVACCPLSLRQMLVGAYAAMWTQEGVGRIFQRAEKTKETQYSHEI
jgi:hypothetical protein